MNLENPELSDGMSLFENDFSGWGRMMMEIKKKKKKFKCKSKWWNIVCIGVGVVCVGLMLQHFVISI
jgi:hypothetical protein